MFVPPAPSAPTVLAGGEAATSVTLGFGDPGREVNANGVDTDYYFEYVDDADYDAAAGIRIAPGRRSRCRREPIWGRPLRF